MPCPCNVCGQILTNSVSQFWHASIEALDILYVVWLAVKMLKIDILLQWCFSSNFSSSSSQWSCGLEAKIYFGLKATLASVSASKIWPRPGLDLVVLLCNRAGQKSCKIREFSGNNLKSYVVNHYLVLFHNHFWPRPWPQPPEIGLDLGLKVLASFNITV